jgi:TonB-linked SusC/RagA family outer membrane protein
MELNPIRFGSVSKKRETKTFFVMRALGLLTIFISLTAFSQSTDSKISLSVSNAPIENVFKEIKKQSGYEFVYTREQLKKSIPVTIRVQSAALDEVLDACFKNQPFTYVIDGKFIALKDRSGSSQSLSNTKNISGTVFGENGAALDNVNVTIESTGEATVTDNNGRFNLKNVKESDVLIVSAVSYQTARIAVRGKVYFNIQLSIAVTQMDETLVIAYGTTTRRLSTGNVSKVSSNEIKEQPVSNVLAAIEGRVPGMIITQSSGVPGSTFSIEVRGRSALDLSLSRNDPLILIDGLPFEAGNIATNLLMSAANNPISASEGGLSALNSISPDDIESIEVLKDADATAIYGSRGANGVIIITTKKGRSGKAKLSASFYAGFSKAPQLFTLMNTRQYVQMRREALANDGLTPDAANAPDITVWDTTRNTDFRKLLIGNTARSSDANLQVSGGNEQSSFLLGGNFHKEATVFPGNFDDKRISLNLNLNHTSLNKKFELSLSTLFSNDDNHLLSLDVGRYLQLPPNLLLYDSAGSLAWEEKGVTFGSIDALNPLAQLNQKYHSINQNLSSSFNVKYQILEGLNIKLTAGYNLFTTDENSMHPKASLAPTAPDLPSSSFADSRTSNWIAEPQLNYMHKFYKGKLDVLLGSSFQEKIYKGNTVLGSNYSSDLLLGSIAAAGDVNASNFYNQYRYQAVFGRIGYNYDNKYLLNLSGRRDGSSRFGPGKQFANFGAVGAGWIFSNENFISKHLHFVSFGKIRASIGITGNDQIGDYKFYDLWNNTFNTYQGTSGLFPTGLFNPYYNWEKNVKQEAAIDLGLFSDRILFSASYYRHRSSNQLINYNLPVQGGFTTVVRNLPALVQNSGVELALSSQNFKSKSFKWNSSFTITVPKNKLLEFPGLSSSPYASSLVMGEPLSVIHRLKYLGIDPMTGVYQFEDLNRDGKLSSLDYQVLGNKDPKFYGGFQNLFDYKGFQLDFFFQFVKQLGANYLSNLYSTIPGTAYNQPTYVLNRWQKPGDMADVQMYSSQLTGAANLASTRLPISNAIYSDASFVRLKTLSLGYTIPKQWVQKMKAESGKIYIAAQNLLTITNYQGADPESQRFFQVPPLRTIAAGIQLTF